MPPNQIFLEMGDVTARDPSCPYAVLPIPYERTVSFGTGTARGPAAILEASFQLEDFDEEFLEPMGLRVQTLPPLNFSGLGEAEAMDRISSAARTVMKARRFLLSLGGEHTITAPLVAVAKALHGRLSVLHIDAHADLRLEYGGTRGSHACVMRRVREMGIGTVSVGVRSLSAAEYRYVRTEGVPIFWAGPIVASADASWVQAVVGLLEEPVYVTFDVDGLDPSVLPGTGTPEPGGLNWSGLLRLLRAVFAAKRVVAADIVELVPVPGSAISEFTAARAGAKMLMYHKHGKR